MPEFYNYWKKLENLREKQWIKDKTKQETMYMAMIWVDVSPGKLTKEEARAIYN